MASASIVFKDADEVVRVSIQFDPPIQADSTLTPSQQAATELFGRLIEQIEVERGSETRHDYPACAIFRGGKCTCDALDKHRCKKCGGTHDGSVSCLGPREPPRPPGHFPKA